MFFASPKLKTIMWSTDSKEARDATLNCSFIKGLVEPFNFLIDSSESIPTIRISPYSFAFFKE